MKIVTHICQQQKGLELGAKPSAFSRPIPPVDRPTTTLSCSRWSAGPKLKLKVLVNGDETSN
jgi:hypothetical protein